MDSLKDLLGRKADKLDIDQKMSDLELAQDVLSRHFNQHAKANRLVQDKLFVSVSSSSAASEVRLKQVVVLEELARVLKQPPLKLIIRQ